MPPHSVLMHATAGLPTVPGLGAADTRALMQAAMGDPAALAASAPRVLAGRYVAVLASAEHHPSAEVFIQAAQALGARIARVVPADLGLSDSTSAGDAARLLGRLYAAIGCAGLDPKSVAFLRRTCGIAVLNDLAGDTHATRLMADVMTLKQAVQEAVLVPPPRPLPRLGVFGRPRSELLRAWRKIAAGVGVDVIDLSEPGTDTEGCHFVCRPGPPPELLAVRTATLRAAPHEASLSEWQRNNHRLVVQVLLRNELSERR